MTDIYHVGLFPAGLAANHPPQLLCVNADCPDGGIYEELYYGHYLFISITHVLCW